MGVPFLRGFIAGTIALVLNFLIWEGGFAPFPPEAAIERFVTVVPASIEQPMIQTFGGGAIYVGILVASVIAAIVYGVLGVIFEGLFLPRAEKFHFLSRFEKFLVYSFAPWLLFGIVVLPISGYGLFGMSSFEPGLPSAYPFTLLLVSGFYSAFLSWQYRGASLSLHSRGAEVVVEKSVTESREAKVASRREFLEKGILAAGAVVFVALGLNNLGSLLGSGVSSNIRAGTPASSVEQGIFADQRLSPLVNSEITDNDSFYEVDIDAAPPAVNSSSWSLLVTRSGRELKTLSLPDLQALSKTEQYTTFECVSNTVNGNLISNAKWTGVKLSDLFQNVGADLSGADYVVFYSVDGYNVGVPLSRTLMPDSIVAYLMNGASLPAAHGYPLRAVIPGLYGMMSAKWINQIDIVDSSTYLGYWQTRGYTNNALVNTLAFIRIPSNNGIVSLSEFSGSVIIGGMAFAGDRGISKVEVSHDGGKTWQGAELKPPTSSQSWTLWALEFENLAEGVYSVYARATDGGGQIQTSSSAGPFPSGATGYATSSFVVVK